MPPRTRATRAQPARTGSGADAGAAPRGWRQSGPSTLSGLSTSSASVLPATSPAVNRRPVRRLGTRSLRDDDDDEDGSDDPDAYDIPSRASSQRVLAERTPTPTLGSEDSQLPTRSARPAVRSSLLTGSSRLDGVSIGDREARGEVRNEDDDDDDNDDEDEDVDEFEDEGGHLQAHPPTLPIPTPTPIPPRPTARAGSLGGDEPGERDTIKVLITTDNHVGYLENDPVRGQDALNSFREALQIAQQEQVDMVLLGGDLFHDNNPSRDTLHQVIGALREYTMGDRPVSLAYISDPRESAHPKYKFGAVNYLEKYYNVSIPVFAIHGNHDDRQGLGADGPLSALDLLSSAGLINYLGKNNLPLGSTSRRTEDQHVDLRPALLQKGTTRLALYGLGNLRDERLAMELRMRRVRMFKPVGDSDSYFNLLAVHQNRPNRQGPTVATVPEGAFDDSIDLVVWGHEHEQRTLPETVPQKSYKICQPGSTVVTSLSQGEEVAKSVALLTIRGKEYQVERRELQTVRPFIIEDFDLEEELEDRGIAVGGERSQKLVLKMLEAKIESLILRAKEQWTTRHTESGEPPDTEMPLPLIRLRVNFEKHEVGNLVRFGSKFTGRIANPKEVLGFNRKRVQRKKNKGGPAFVDPQEMGVMERLEKLDLSKIISSIVQGQDFEGLPGLVLDQGLQTSVDKDDKNALRDAVQRSIKRQMRGALDTTHGMDEIKLSLEESYQRELDLARKQFGTSHTFPSKGPRGDNMELDEPPASSVGSRKASRAPPQNTRRNRPEPEPEGMTVSDDERPRDMPVPQPAPQRVRQTSRRSPQRKQPEEPEEADAEWAPTAHSRAPARATRVQSPGKRPNYVVDEDEGDDDDYSDGDAYKPDPQSQLFLGETQASEEFEDELEPESEPAAVARGTKRRGGVPSPDPPPPAPKRAARRDLSRAASTVPPAPTPAGGSRARALAWEPTSSTSSVAPGRGKGRQAARPQPGSDSDIEYMGQSQSQASSQAQARAAQVSQASQAYPAPRARRRF